MCGAATRWEDPDPLDVPISAIEHFSYCPRQCALIHVEQTFEENVYTVRGHLAHQRVDTGEVENRPGVRVLRGIPLWSEGQQPGTLDTTRAGESELS